MAFIDIIKNFLNNENYLNFISMIVVAITTYCVTKYSAMKPHQLKIKQLQLEHVYLPLHRLLEHMQETPSRNEIQIYSKEISYILDKYYILAFPQLHSLNQSLTRNSGSRYKCSELLHVIKHQVDTDYELLKKILGYPSVSFYNIFIRMTPLRKIETITTLIIFIIPLLLTIFTLLVGKNMIIDKEVAMGFFIISNFILIICMILRSWSFRLKH